MSKLPEYRSLGCVVTKNRSAWCNQFCKPEDENGVGLCGRLAPHSVKGRTQKAIESYRERTGSTSK